MIRLLFSPYTQEKGIFTAKVSLHLVIFAVFRVPNFELRGEKGYWLKVSYAVFRGIFSVSCSSMRSTFI